MSSIMKLWSVLFLVIIGIQETFHTKSIKEDSRYGFGKKNG